MQTLEDRTFFSAFTVTNALDDGSAGSLRWAIGQANATAGADTINFDTAVFAKASTIVLTRGELLLTDPAKTTINGPGANLLTISANKASRVFHVGKGASTALAKMTVADGVVGIVTDEMGGDVYNEGTATLTSMTIRGGTATYGGGVGASGGLSINSIFVAPATTTLTNCTISGNSAAWIGGGVSNGFGLGTQNFGISIEPGGPMTITNCTISGNAVTSPTTLVVTLEHTAGNGGGVANCAGSTTMANCTVSGNTASNSYMGTGIFSLENGPYQPVGPFTVSNTIVTGNRNRDLDPRYVSAYDTGGPFVSNGHNLIGVPGVITSGWLATDKLGTLAAPTDAKLAPLGNYGGATQTMALLPGSIAINGAVSGTGIPTTDERGRTRIGAVDIGAFESQGYHLVAGTGGGQTAYAGVTFAKPLIVRCLENTTNAAMPGVTIAVASPAGGVAAQIPVTPTALTDAAGNASLTITANSLYGAYTVTASVPATPTTPTVSFALTNVLPPRLLTATTLTDGRLATNLRGAIIAFNNDPGTADDTIRLNAGTYTLSLTSAPDEAGSRDLDITSTAHKLIIQGTVGTTGAPATIIDARSIDRIFQIANPGTIVEFSNLVIQRGRADSGGAIFNNGGNLSFKNVTFTSNQATSFYIGGGAIYTTQGSVALDTCTFTSNSAGQGGAIFSDGSTLNVKNSTFTSNKASSAATAAVSSGGAIYATGNTTITASTFTSNQAVGSAGTGALASGNAGNSGGYAQGGAIWLNGPAVITDTSFSTNSAIGGIGATGPANKAGGGGGGAIGGAMFVDQSGSVIVLRSTFNTSTAQGGQGGAGGTNKISGATAGQGGFGGGAYGGGIWLRGSDTASSFTNCTITGSSAVAGAAGPGGTSTAGGTTGKAGVAGGATGGAAYIGYSTVKFTNCTIARNSALTTGGLWVVGGTTTLNNSILAANTGGDLLKGAGATLAGGFNLIGLDKSGTNFINGVNGNIVGTTTAIDPKLGALANNGGLTQTMALLAGSPAIDKGSNALAVDAAGKPLLTDQRGLPRIVGFAVNIGAFEGL